MTQRKFLTHGNFKELIQDAHLDVVCESPNQAKHTAGVAKIWVVADVFVFREGSTNRKLGSNPRNTGKLKVGQSRL